MCCVCLAMEEAPNSEYEMLNKVCFVLGKGYQRCTEIRFSSGWCPLFLYFYARDFFGWKLFR